MSTDRPTGTTSGARSGTTAGTARRAPGPRWLGTAVLVVAVLELVLGVVSMVVGAVVPGLVLLSSGLVIGTLMLGLRGTG